MAVDQSELLKVAIDTLLADAALTALLGAGRVFNHVPQDESKPYVVLFWEANIAWDTKDSDGFEGTLDHESVTVHHGDRNVLRIMDAIIAAYLASPLVLTSGKVVCLDYQSGSVAVTVQETHRATAVFSVLVDDDL